ncbi:hypothetical protein HMI54_009320 [Coelomomyces lativittatus]|nr:hypothetical protein HMI56_007505 [Coelomomyces lativittatus]KAJ1509848.1 hypothetical protein HMI55_007236 [Coelomomyces lativittatus]KAJ1516474.1 hypothetical protein HMI54_009320 [Coelomomyces lativittatus]
MDNHSLDSYMYLNFCQDDEAELVVIELLEEILKKSQEVLFEKHISSQVLPYAVQFCKDSVVQLAKWEFFECDTVDSKSNMWIPDEEPSPIPNDSWAKGVLIPVPMSNDELKKRPRVPWDATHPIVSAK